MRIAKYYDWSKNYKAAIIYYNDVVRKQPKTADAEFSKTRIEELRGQVGDDALRVGSERAESGEKLALRRRLQAQVETSSLADYSGPSRRDIVPDELPIVEAAVPAHGIAGRSAPARSGRTLVAHSMIRLLTAFFIATLLGGLRLQARGNPPDADAFGAHPGASRPSRTIPTSPAWKC